MLLLALLNQALLLILKIRRRLQTPVMLLLLLLLMMMMMIIVHVVTVLMCRYEYAESVLTVHAEYTVDCAHSLWLRDAFLPPVPPPPPPPPPLFPLLPLFFLFLFPPSFSFRLLAFLHFFTSSSQSRLVPSCALVCSLLSPLFSSPHLREGLLETGRCTGPEIPIPTFVGLNF